METFVRFKLEASVLFAGKQYEVAAINLQRDFFTAQIMTLRGNQPSLGSA
jgi:hypothetical protein